MKGDIHESSSKIFFKIRQYKKSGRCDCQNGRLPGRIDTRSASIEEHVDILFLGAAVYWGGISAEVKNYIRTLDKDKVGKAVVFSTSALAERAFPQIKEELQAAGVPVEDENFYCRGQFTALHKGHPNQDDLTEAEQFAKEMMKEE